jgi:hypothetical protein
MTTALEGGEGSASRPDRSLLPGETRYPLYKKVGWAPGPVWTGAENLTRTGIRSPDLPAPSQSLYLKDSSGINISDQLPNGIHETDYRTAYIRPTTERRTSDQLPNGILQSNYRTAYIRLTTERHTSD